MTQFGYPATLTFDALSGLVGLLLLPLMKPRLKAGPALAAVPAAA